MSILPETAADYDADSVFVSEFVKTGDATTACIVAGIRDNRYDIRVTAEKTLARPEIRTAIEALQRIYQVDVAQPEITLDSVVADMQVIYQKAVDDGQYQAAIAAKKLQASLRGWLDQKIDITLRRSVDEMSTKDLERLAQGYLKTTSIAAAYRDADDADYEALPAPEDGG